MIISNLPIDLGRVKQNYSTDNENRPLLMSGVAGVSSTSDRGSNESVINNSIYANPSTGTIHANISGNISGSSGSCTGNAATATALQTARSINGTNFDGSGNITTTKWGTARSMYIQDADGTNTSSAVSVNGASDHTLKLPSTIKATLTGDVTGNLTGNVTGNCSGTAANVTGTVAIANGGTGATTRLIAFKNLTNESVGESAQFFITITSNWGKVGYTTIAQAKKVLGIDSVTNVDSSKAITAITRSGTTFTYTCVDGSTGTFDQQDNNTTYSNMTAATASAAGKAGLVPAPAAGKQTSFLRGDGTWVVPTNTTYSAMSAAEATTGTATTARSITAKVLNDKIDEKISALVASAPETLDTLNELASALGNDSNFATTVATQIGTKANANHNHDSVYVKLTGGTITNNINKVGVGCSWKDGRTNAVIKTNATSSPSNNQYVPCISSKSYQGSWELGTYTNNDYYLTYITDADFDAGTNNATTQYKFCSDGTLVADKFKGALEGNVTGNANSATKLQTARTINGTIFDGSGNIITTNWGTARDISIQDHNAGHTGSAVSVNGSGNVTLKLPSTINADVVGYLTGNISGSSSSCTGNSATATTAGAVSTVVADGSVKDVVYAHMAGSDTFRIRCGGGGDDGYVEIATSDNGNEPIYVRQYSNVGGNQPDGFNTIARTLTLLDGSGNTQFPGTVTAPTFSGNLNGNCSGSSSSCTGNAATATKLQTVRTINGTNFDGSGNITTANWGTARKVSIQDHNAGHTGSAVSVNGSGNVTLKLPSTIHADIDFPITEAEIDAIFNGNS